MGAARSFETSEQSYCSALCNNWADSARFLTSTVVYLGRLPHMLVQRLQGCLVYSGECVIGNSVHTITNYKT
jgi:hypothetical protein